MKVELARVQTAKPHRLQKHAILFLLKLVVALLTRLDLSGFGLLRRWRLDIGGERDALALRLFLSFRRSGRVEARVGPSVIVVVASSCSFAPAGATRLQPPSSSCPSDHRLWPSGLFLLIFVIVAAVVLPLSPLLDSLLGALAHGRLDWLAVGTEGERRSDLDCGGLPLRFEGTRGGFDTSSSRGILVHLPGRPTLQLLLHRSLVDADALRVVLTLVTAFVHLVPVEVRIFIALFDLECCGLAPASAERLSVSLPAELLHSLFAGQDPTSAERAGAEQFAPVRHVLRRLGQRGEQTHALFFLELLGDVGFKALSLLAVHRLVRRFARVSSVLRDHLAGKSH